MTSELDATYLPPTILSKDDPRVKDLEYKVGDRFLHRADFDGSWDIEIVEELIESFPIIVEIDSFFMTEKTRIGYRVRFIHPELEWKWYLNDNIIKKYFKPIGRNGSETRFLMLED